ncbi:hypothetical protein [Methylobacter sp. S3L5C]|uniref:hypothetical protein n=1 Tax=Methylobacter sp. S3L5C TaxID=2839024 RepID=UPI001FAC1791|nr:hypothetical protein [Methylobacter sp. S3L5C]UOA07771.1 hypothetical protein KKZ03_16160 [Methylobacter sp. S3L5C]
MIPCILVEVIASIAGVETTLYLSTKGYVSGAADNPANTVYMPAIAGGVQVTEEISLDGSAAMSYGDIELYNVSGERDGWLDYVWSNRTVKVFNGNLGAARSSFTLLFDGVVDDIGSSSRDRINLKIRDKLQRLNCPVSDTKLGGTTANADMVLPLVFGEVCNITPLLTNPATLEYQVHNGAIESIIEVRDNGVPITTFTANLTTGKFVLTIAPAGVITCSVQGSKQSTYINTVSSLIQRLATAYGKLSTRFVAGDLDIIALATFESAHTQAVGTYLSGRENVITTMQELAASIGAQVVITRAGKLSLLQIAFPPLGVATAITNVDMVQSSLHIVRRLPVKSSVKFGYCKNWTVQNNLQTGIPESSKNLLNTEFLTVTSSNATVAANYKLDAEPVQVNTVLINTTEATAEAERQLAIYSVPRTIYGFEGFSRCLDLVLGQAVTLTHSRFGLNAGKTGIVTKLQPDWINFRVQIEVMI